MHAQLACVSIVTEVAHRVQLMGKTVVVKGRDGWPFSAHAEPGPSGIVFRDEAGRDVMNIADTVEMTEVDNNVGGLEGLLFGASPGIAVGAVAGLLQGDDDCTQDEPPCFSAGTKALALGVVGGLVGGLVGSIVGGSRGSRFIYRFDHSGRSRAASR
jgi:hypothetical protein